MSNHPRGQRGRANFGLVSALIFLSLSSVNAQTTSFTYQGRLTDGGNAANGSYDFQFALFDSSSAGAQIGSTLTRTGVAVTGGTFSAQLDFGVSAFPGVNRFLEIGVRPAGVGSFTILAPRQQISSTPYAIRTLSATQADALSSACSACVQDSQISSVAGSKVTGTVPVAALPTGSGNYIQNTNSPQASANFNISGNGTAGGTISGNVINTTTQYNLGGNRLLSGAGANNLFIGPGTGQSNTTGSGNTFAGVSAGQANVQGKDNSFFGHNAGQNNTGVLLGTLGNENSFFGSNAGSSNTTGTFNSFFGANAGANNTGGSNNAFFGDHAGFSNTADDNSFFGTLAGQSNTQGTANSFFGRQAGAANTTSQDNSFFGYFAGANSISPDNSFFGSEAGANTTIGFGNSFFGSFAGLNNTTGSDNSFFGLVAGINNTTGQNNTFIGAAAGNPSGSQVSNSTAIGSGATVSCTDCIALGDATVSDLAVGIGTSSPIARLDVAGGPIWTSNGWLGSLQLNNATAIGWHGNGAGWHFGIGQTNGGLLFFRSGDPIGGIQTPAEYALMITDNGAVGVNTTNPDQTFSVNGNASKSGGGSWLVFSDERLKTIKGRFTSGLEAVMELQPIRYEYKSNNPLGINPDGEHIGFGAQTVQKIIPEAVSKDDKGYLLVNNDPILWTMLNAIKDQQKEIQQLRKQLRRLRAATNNRGKRR